MLLVSAAMDYLLHNPNEPVDIAAFEEAAGVGVVVTPDQVEEAVSLAVISVSLSDGTDSYSKVKPDSSDYLPDN